MALCLDQINIQERIDTIVAGELHEAAKRYSRCLRRKVAAVAVTDNMIILSAVNGAPIEAPSCEELGGCYREINNIPSGSKASACRAMHAEASLIVQAMRKRISLENMTIYSTTRPCTYCTGLLIEAGVKEVRYLEDYPDELSRKMQEQSPVSFVKIDV